MPITLEIVAHDDQPHDTSSRPGLVVVAGGAVALGPQFEGAPSRIHAPYTCSVYKI